MMIQFSDSGSLASPRQDKRNSDPETSWLNFRRSIDLRYLSPKVGKGRMISKEHY
jgi:hypothetical protein